jgi:hypothetical protein
MDPVALAKRGQRMAESLMVDRVRAVRLGKPVTSPDGDVTTPETPLYEGMGKVQTWEGVQSNPDSGGQIATVQRYTVHVPVGAWDVRIGDVIDVITATLDPLLAGRRYRVVSLLHKSLPTAYRLGVEEVL